MKTSLAEETLDVLEYAGKSPADVDLVAFSVEGVLRTCGLAAFLEAAVRMTSDPYLGVDDDLILVGVGGEWWLERTWLAKKQRWEFREGYVDLRDVRPADWPPTPSQLTTP